MSFDGKLKAQSILETYKKHDWSKCKLVIIQANDDDSSDSFIKQKLIACNTVGAKSELIKLSNQITQAELIEKIISLNHDVNVTGIILQLPVYPHLDKNSLLEAINPLKDVDGLTTNHLAEIKPCIVEAMITLKELFNLEFNNQKIVVVGLGITGGKPIYEFLKTSGYKVQACDKDTPNTFELIKSADIVFTAIGKSHFFQAKNFKKGVILFDIGVSRNKQNKLCGDINPEGIEKKARWWTKTPGGVGPFTVLAIIKNLWILHEKNKRCLQSSI
ncbi:tetrahydrofolate dehydrogenase/cyclohydrolase catalytic domain-containing protein [Mycoplasmoides genitalium]